MFTSSIEWSKLWLSYHFPPSCHHSSTPFIIVSVWICCLSNETTIYLEPILKTIPLLAPLSHYSAILVSGSVIYSINSSLKRYHQIRIIRFVQGRLSLIHESVGFILFRRVSLTHFFFIKPHLSFFSILKFCSVFHLKNEIRSN